MKKRTSKNPTMKEVKNVISNIIKEMTYMHEYLSKLDATLYKYVLFNKDDAKFKKWLEKEANKEAKDDKSSNKNKKSN